MVIFRARLRFTFGVTFWVRLRTTWRLWFRVRLRLRLGLGFLIASEFGISKEIQTLAKPKRLYNREICNLISNMISVASFLI